ncbi:hypothetical protein IG193_00310 [Infirmifilum lucidum]|uniref:Citrate transporter-like domain-containing protein n=1 Tax=Infirmifilum lucidum TaxID=2776706 RepID=A0A7L9FJ50_9CREN|nr:SLC13 family permease [Infirmifilum lucidum]QOJ78944.1 hypothetical protein IG193_00310 [Infirmifilum lucidum]
MFVRDQTVPRLVAVLFTALAAAFFSYLAGFPPKAVLALSVFFAEISATLLLWANRLPIAFIGTGLLFFLGALDVKSFLEFANLDVIFFLVGMMAFIGVLEERMFFEHLVAKVLDAFRGNGVLVVFSLMVLSGALAALIDEVTSIVIMTSFALALARAARVSPVPLVLLSVFATNIGSSATVIGNPVGVLVAFRGGLTFGDFLRWATPISTLALAIVVVLSFRFFRGYIYEFSANISRGATPLEPEGGGVGGFGRDAVLFASTVVALALHHQLEELLHLEKNTLLMAIPFIAAGISIVLDLEVGMRAFREKVEWPTVVFFALLFASVGALESSGFTEYFSHLLAQAGGGVYESTLVVYTVAATLMSAFMDNVLAVAVLLPVVEKFQGTGIPVFPFYWVTLFSATIGGNLTFIGSTANIVALSLLEKAGHEKPSFSEWVRHSSWASLVPLAVAVLLVYLQTPLMP